VQNLGEGAGRLNGAAVTAGELGQRPTDPLCERLGAPVGKDIPGA
jgi:hypothetical protein